MKLNELKSNPQHDPWDGDEDEDAENKKNYMKKFGEIFPHLDADKDSKIYAMKQNIGRKIKYKLPTDKKELAQFLRRHGEVARGTFQIIGVQKDWKGDYIYRATNIEYNGKPADDTVGRGMDPKLIQFI